MRFVADVMLGRLARFLRFRGYDVEYDHRATDEELLLKSRRRIVLTKDRPLARTAGFIWLKRPVQKSNSPKSFANSLSHFLTPRVQSGVLYAMQKSNGLQKGKSNILFRLSSFVAFPNFIFALIAGGFTGPVRITNECTV